MRNLKRIYLIKKDTSKQNDSNNWIEMSVDEYNRFATTDEGQKRKVNIAPLFGFEFGDTDYFVEMEPEEAKKVRSEYNRHCYLQQLEADSGIMTVSSDELDIFDENEKGDFLVDEDAFVDRIYEEKETTQEIQKALMMLTEKQRDIIISLIYTDNPMKVSEYAKLNGLTAPAVIQTRDRALKQLGIILRKMGIGG